VKFTHLHVQFTAGFTDLIRNKLAAFNHRTSNSCSGFKGQMLKPVFHTLLNKQISPIIFLWPPSCLSFARVRFPLSALLSDKKSCGFCRACAAGKLVSTLYLMDKHNSLTVADSSDDFQRVSGRFARFFLVQYTKTGKICKNNLKNTTNGHKI
jgi:hypothetical protein